MSSVVGSGVAEAEVALEVLVAEDDPHDQMLFVMAADDSDIELSISFVSDGEELLDELRARAATNSLPDLVVLDLWMPKVDGHEVLEALDREPALRPGEVGVLSSSYRQLDIDRSIDGGAAWHEVKPSRYEDLVGFVHRVAAQTLAKRRSGDGAD